MVSISRDATVTQVCDVNACCVFMEVCFVLSISLSKVPRYPPQFHPPSRTLFCLRFSSRFWDLGILPHTERKMSNSLALLVLSPEICSKISQRCETVHSTPKETRDKATLFKQQKPAAGLFRKRDNMTRCA